MNLMGHYSRKELLVTLCIWITLIVCAGGALWYLRSNAVRIIDNIHYVNVSRGAKAEVLYAEAEKNARLVLQKSEQLNLESGRKISVPSSDKRLQATLKLFHEAFRADIRPEFDPERTMFYELLGQVYDAAGSHPEEVLAHARAFISQNDTSDAVDYIDKARVLDADSPEPLVLLAQLHVKNDETSQALAVLDDLYTSYPVSAKARWVKFQVLQKMGIPDEAILELTQAVAEDPTNLSYRRDLGLALAGAQRISEAADAMAAGLSDGGWLDAAYLHVYGENLVAMEDLDEAIRVLQQADYLAPYSGDIQWSLARAFHRAGKARQAASALRRATEAKPELHDTIF